MQPTAFRRPARSLAPLLLALLICAALGALPAARPARAAGVEQWTQVGMVGVNIDAVMVDPHDSRVIYASAPYGKLHKSSDGGATWPLLWNFGYSDPPPFTIDPVDSQVIYASNISVASKSIDGGASWVTLDIISNSNLDDINVFGVSPLDHQVVYAASEFMTGMRRSVNGGASWSLLADYPGVIAMAVAADGVAYAAGRNDLFGSSDSDPVGIFKVSETIAWTQVYSGEINALAVDPLDPRVIYAGGEGQGVLKSVDGGASWAPANSGLGHLVVRALAVDPTRPQVVYAGTWEGGVYRSVNGGASWAQINSGLGNLYISSLSVDTQNPQVIYAGTIGGGIYRWLGPPPPDPADAYAQLRDGAGSPIAGARLYHNGQLVGEIDGRPRRSDALGNLIIPGGLAVGDSLVALAPQQRRASARGGAAGWAYEVYTTNLTVAADGGLQSYRVVNPTGAQPITVRPDRTLILFNLIVSVEWDADQAYLDELKRAFRRASDYLLDLSDGQMAFGAVTIYDRGAAWGDADVQVATSNIVRPHAFVGGLISADRAQVMRLGRQWDGLSGASGAWDQPDGYRTIAHEFGHYGLHLYDEYFGYARDGQGNLSDEVAASCSGPQNRLPAGDATNASAMDYQYTSSELSARGVAGLWSATCEQTAQFQINGASAWETMAARYADSASPPRWSLITPAARGAIQPGPAGLPADRLDLPALTALPAGGETQLRRLLVLAPDGQPQRGASVSLYRQDGRVFSEGFTDNAGTIEIYGAQPNDRLRVASVDRGAEGEVTIGADIVMTIKLRSIGGRLAAAGDIPHLQIIPDAGGAGQATLHVVLLGFGSGADPGLLVRTPDGVGFAPNLSYSPARDSYEAQVSFSATERGTGSLQALGGVGSDLVRIYTTYRVQQVDNAQNQEAFSDDGNLRLYLEPGSLADSSSYLVVMPPGAIPGPLPAGLALVGDCYSITASGSATTFARPAMLSLSFDKALAGHSAPAGLAIYRWDAGGWARVGGDLDADHRVLSATVSALGSYALLAPASDLGSSKAYLPAVRR